MLDEEITMIDKVIGTASYLTAGWVGFIWQIISVIAKRRVSRFLLFHIYQSILLSIIILLAFWLISCVQYLISFIPFVNVLFNSIMGIIFYPMFFNCSLINFAIIVLYIYLALCCFAGRISKLPWLSDIISYQLNRF